MAKHSNRLRVLRAERRKTQIAIAQASGMYPSKLSLIENGYIEPSDDERAALAKALGVSEAEAFPEVTA